MSTSPISKIVGVISLLFTGAVQAQDSQDVYNNQRGLCTFEFDNAGGYFAYNGGSIPDGTWDTAVGSGAADHPFIVYCKFQFVGQAERVTQTATYRNTNVVPTIVVPFTNAPVTSIVPGSPAECTVFPGSVAIQGFALSETYALVPATSIPPFVTSTTVVVPTSAVTTTSMLTSRTYTE
jgi:hypothetical protein